MSDFIPVRIVEPTVTAVPVVVDSPHSGMEWPADFDTVAPREAIRTTWDAFVDDLWSGAPSAGATLLAANFPAGLRRCQSCERRHRPRTARRALARAAVADRVFGARDGADPAERAPRRPDVRPAAARGRSPAADRQLPCAVSRGARGAAGAAARAVWRGVARERALDEVAGERDERRRRPGPSRRGGERPPRHDGRRRAHAVGRRVVRGTRLLHADQRSLPGRGHRGEHRRPGERGDTASRWSSTGRSTWTKRPSRACRASPRSSRIAPISCARSPRYAAAQRASGGAP